MFPYGHRHHEPPAPVDLGAVAAVEPAAMNDKELDGLLDGLEANQRALDAARLSVLGEYTHRGLHDSQGAVSPANVLAHRHGRDPKGLRSIVTTATKLRRLPLMAEALNDGTVTADHAQALSGALTAKTAEAMTRDEKRLVRLAHRLGAHDYRNAVRYWAAHADPDGTDPDTGARNELWLSETFEGVGILKARLSPELLSMVKSALGNVMDELRRDTDDDPDHGAVDSEHTTSPAEKRAEAFAELVRRGGAVTEDGEPQRRTRPQVIVTIDYENLVDEVGLAELDTGAAIRASAVRRLACDADIIAAVFGCDSELLDLARRARLVSPAQRAALAMRDRGCAFPNCDRPAGWCDAHHIEHWLDGGPTDLVNLILLCSKHHHLLHEGGWSLHRDGCGEFVFTSPAGLVVANAPRPTGHPDPWLRDPPERRAPARGAPTGDNDEHQRPHLDGLRRRAERLDNRVPVA